MALSQEQQNAITLRFLGCLQRRVDMHLIAMEGRDRQLFHGGPGRELEVVSDSALGFYSGLKERLVRTASNVRNGAPLLDE